MRALRLSVVVGLASASWHAWTVFSRYTDDIDQWQRMRFVYECAARIDDAKLQEHTNEFGNINVQPLFCADQEFLVSMKEIKRVRNGTMDFHTPYRPYYVEGSITVGIIGMFLTIASAAALFGAVTTLRWVWGRS